MWAVFGGCGQGYMYMCLPIAGVRVPSGQSLSPSPCRDTYLSQAEAVRDTSLVPVLGTGLCASPQFPRMRDPSPCRRPASSTVAWYMAVATSVERTDASECTLLSVNRQPRSTLASCERHACRRSGPQFFDGFSAPQQTLPVSTLDRSQTWRTPGAKPRSLQGYG
ncbi:hypothetical protein K466DRAFT_170890 [Polyporus arcularius HHB13444]|uniref:Uncharacterized protein n=1 Tax=Polyporus arcularius HHB13444 TaxID=1314778 RepID=A0A5C3PAN9_9APHY|nr:hypothetical protein K466DRAFT_170890 [Polyporus arcularius HHB13444]